MKTEVKQIGGASVLALSGRVTLGEASQSIQSTLEQLRSDGAQQIVLNLSEVTFIDSAGLGVLVMNLIKAKAEGGMLKLAEPQARVKDALEMTRLTGMFPLYATEQEALNSFQPPRTVAPVQ